MGMLQPMYSYVGDRRLLLRHAEFPGNSGVTGVHGVFILL